MPAESEPSSVHPDAQSTSESTHVSWVTSGFPARQTGRRCCDKYKDKPDPGLQSDLHCTTQNLHFFIMISLSWSTIYLFSGMSGLSVDGRGKIKESGVHRLLRYDRLFIFIVVTLNQSVHRTNTLTHLPPFWKTTTKKRSKNPKTLILGCYALEQIVHIKKIGREKWVGSLAKIVYKRSLHFYS